MILYYIVVRNVEINQTNGRVELTQATAEPESFWIVFVFVIYAAWDFVSDVLESTRHFRTAVKLTFVCVSVSIICALLSLLVFLAATQSAAFAQVLFLDGALLCVIFLFRNLKVFEETWARKWDITGTEPFETPRDESKYDRRLCVFLSIAYVACMLGAWVSH